MFSNVKLFIRGTFGAFCPLWPTIETVSPEGTFCDTVQIPSSVGDMELIEIIHGHLSHHPVLF